MVSSIKQILSAKLKRSQNSFTEKLLFDDYAAEVKDEILKLNQLSSNDCIFLVWHEHKKWILLTTKFLINREGDVSDRIPFQSIKALDADIDLSKLNKLGPSYYKVDSIIIEDRKDRKFRIKLKAGIVSFIIQVIYYLMNANSNTAFPDESMQHEV